MPHSEMAKCLISPSLIPSSPPHPHLQGKSLVSFSLPTRSNASFGALGSGKRPRGEAVVVRAGPPSSNSLILAFALPLSLLAGTIFASIRIADRLDEKYLQELAMNQAIMEENEAADEDDKDEADTTDGDGMPILPPLEEEGVVAPRARNRPRRQA